MKTCGRLVPVTGETKRARVEVTFTRIPGRPARNNRPKGGLADGQSINFDAFNLRPLGGGRRSLVGCVGQ